MAPFWTEEIDSAPAKIQPGAGLLSQKLVVLPADYSGDWHPDPQATLFLLLAPGIHLIVCILIGPAQLICVWERDMDYTGRRTKAFQPRGLLFR